MLQTFASSFVWAFLTYWLSGRFIEKLQGEIPGKGVKELLQALSHVYALSLVSTHAGDFLATGYLTSNQIALAKNQLRALFVKVVLFCEQMIVLFSCSLYVGFLVTSSSVDLVLDVGVGRCGQMQWPW